MILLDTDHLSVLTMPEESRHELLVSRMSSKSDLYGLPIVSVEEQMRGWLAVLSSTRGPRDFVRPYERLTRFFSFLSTWRIVAFDADAALEFERLRKAGVRIGSQDLKIASIALARGETLLTANFRDFRRVPGLQIENWLSKPAEESGR